MRDWVVLELSPQGEDEDPEVLASALARVFRDKTVEIFIPASVSIVGESRVIHKLIDNYVFVRRTLPDSAYMRLEGTRYVASVLTVARALDRKTSYREMACVRDVDIDKMRRQIHVETEQGIEVGDEVQVMNGPYKGINGRIITEIPETDSVQVYIKLRSKEAIVTLPRSFLRFVSKDQSDLPTFTFSPFMTKIERIREWGRLVQPILSWVPSGFREVEQAARDLGNIGLGLKRLDRVKHIRRQMTLPSGPPPITPLLHSHQGVRLFGGWLDRSRKLGFQVKPTPVIDKVAEKYGLVNQMDSLIKRGPAWFQYLQAAPALATLPTLNAQVEAKMLESRWLQDIVQRLNTLARNVGNVEALTGRPDMFENVIIDGHNLAYRVSHALGAMKKPLTDAEGNPTSLVFGFLKSLTSLKKRFANASIYVVWDGSPQRRIDLFEGYKIKRRAKRAAERAANGSLNGASVVGPESQMSRLRNILPLLGVIQAFNAEEETDDVIACLVRGKLKGQRNVILSTDQDFLQLVTLTDIVLSPKVGNRQETLYDRDKVVEEYGVTPESMVQLRALLGDDSDEVPGVGGRVPTKVLTALLKNYGSVDEVFASNLSGITAGQYAKIRAAEPQVRLNLILMQLRDDLSFDEIAPNPDAKAISDVLGGLSIQADSIVEPFFPASSRGFAKRQEQLAFSE
jgi:DNA polymerase-1